MNDIEEIIRDLNLEPHPEGGYFRETYRSMGEISSEHLGPDFSGNRNFSTCIFFLLTTEMFSAFHRIRQDEIWHFYKGRPIRLHMITAEGEYSNVLVGNQLDKGEMPQFTVPGRVWFSAETIGENGYSLAGCTVSPGFDFNDFEMADQEELLSRFPQHREVITKFTRT
ncbi:MAG TPA: cupin domain-containing protein [Eudoraea sp.]|nr:cupin domain-containing protein [Eudoraea sp.]